MIGTAAVAVAAGTLGIVGLIFLLISLLMKSSLKDLMECCTEQTQANVIEYLKKRGSQKNEQSAYYPVLKYKVGNKKYKKRYNYGSSKQSYKIGQEITLCYDPKNPERFYLPDDKIPRLLNTVFFWVGIGLLSAALLTFLIGFIAMNLS